MSPARLDDDIAEMVHPVSEEDVQSLSQGIRSRFSGYDEQCSAHEQCSAQATELRLSRDLQLLLKRLLKTHVLPDISGPHRVASCNLLCALVQACLNSTVLDIRALGSSTDLWQSVFNLYLHRSDHSKVKSMRLVLSTLGAMLLSNIESPVSTALQDLLSARLVSIIFDEDAHSRVKPAFQALDFFLSKRTLPLARLLAAPRLSSRTAGPSSAQVPGSSGPASVTSAPDETAETLVARLVSRSLRWVSHPDVAPAAGKAVVALYDEIRRSPCNGLSYYAEDSGQPIWVGTIEESIRQQPESLEAFKQHLFPDLFSLHVADLSFLLKALKIEDFFAGGDLEDQFRASFLFSVLHVGKELGFVQEPGSVAASTVKEEPDSIVLPSVVLAQYLTHQSSTIRAAALSLLVTSPSTTRPISADVFRILVDKLSHLHADIDSKFRNDLLTITKRLTHRLRGGTSLLNREVHGGSCCSARSGVETAMPKDAQLSLDNHNNFLHWYINFLMVEMQPTSRYQGHITALKAVTILLQSGLDRRVPHSKLSRSAQKDLRWPMHVPLFTPALYRLLLDLLMDPFEDVRTGASAVLQMLSGERPEDGNGHNIQSSEATAVLEVASTSTKEPFEPLSSIFPTQEEAFRKRSHQRMLQSCRADHSDGYARGYELHFQRCGHIDVGLGMTELTTAQESLFTDLLVTLESQIDLATQNLVKAATDSPMHGNLTSLRYILGSGLYVALEASSKPERARWKELHHRVTSNCVKLWQCVKDVLCNDHPEGHLPEHDEDVDVDSKDVLSFSWRALKESSLLLKTVIIKAGYSPGEGSSILDKADFAAIGNLTFAQLAGLRHRGAFSAVSLTFSACCQRCSDVKDPDVQALLHQWFAETMRYIRNNSIINTRRSAGIPSLITGLVCANPSGPLSRIIFQELFAEAHGKHRPLSVGAEAKLPQVHAMNCLKDIFTDTRLGASSETYITEGLDLAVTSLASSTWAIRNGGIMLFRALVDRLIGTSSLGHRVDVDWSCGSCKISYAKYNNLVDLLPRLLKVEAQSKPRPDSGPNLSLENSVQMVFPALDLLRRAGPPKQIYAALQSMVLDHLDNPVWHIRDLAARTYCTLLATQDVVRAVKELLQYEWTCQNGLHGMLLSVRYSVDKAATRHEPTQCGEVLKMMAESELFPDKLCLLNQIAFFEVINSLLTHASRELIESRHQGHKGSIALSHVRTILQQGGLGFGPDDAVNMSEPPRPVLAVTSGLFLCLEGTNDAGFRAMLEQLLSYPEALLSLLRGLVHLAPFASTSDGLQTMLLHLIRACASAAKERECPEMASHTMRSIAELFDECSWIRAVFVDGSDRRSSVQSTFSDAVAGLVPWQGAAKHTSPSGSRSELRLRGHDLARRYNGLDTEGDRSGGRSLEALEDLTGSWCYMVREGLREDNDFDTRNAAIQSLAAFVRCLTGWQSHRADPILVQAFLNLYDALNDDDDEIRDMAATLVSRVLADASQPGSASSLNPLAASRRLAEWLAAQHPQSLALCQAAMHRLAGTTLSTVHLDRGDGEGELIPSVRQALAKAMKDDTSLFVVEKPNLFIDQVREADIWSKVLGRLPLWIASDDFARTLRRWVVGGMSELTLMASKEPDGPLGWASKPDVFTIGMRVLLGADAILQWSRTRSGVVEDTEIREALEQLAAVGREKDLHALWLATIEAILEETG